MMDHTSPILYPPTTRLGPLPVRLQDMTMDSPNNDLLDPQNLQKLRLHVPPGQSARPPSPRIHGQFLRGPIPMSWLETAAKLPGKAPLAVALTIRFEAGRQANSQAVKLTNPLVARLGVSRKSKYSALIALQQAGLIDVLREPKK